MFSAACRKSWLSCAKGHTHRLTVSTAATCHYDKTSANLPLRSTTSPLRCLQRLTSRCWSSSLSCRPELDLQRPDPLFSVVCLSNYLNSTAGLRAVFSVCTVQMAFVPKRRRSPFWKRPLLRRTRGGRLKIKLQRMRDISSLKSWWVNQVYYLNTCLTWSKSITAGVLKLGSGDPQGQRRPVPK